jgi:hypothetical protein
VAVVRKGSLRIKMMSFLMLRMRKLWTKPMIRILQMKMMSLSMESEVLVERIRPTER